MKNSYIAMALHFNSKCSLGYSHREVMKRVKSVMKLNRDEWRVKLNAGELKEAYTNRNLKIAEIKREKSTIKRDEAVELRKSGMILKDIATKLGVSITTVKRWKLPKC